MMKRRDYGACSRIRAGLALVIALIISTPLLPGRDAPQVCGWRPRIHEEVIETHERSVRLLRQNGELRLRTVTDAAPLARDVGDVAILGDGEGVVVRANSYTLRNRSLRFEPVAGSVGAYRVTQSGYSFEDNAGGETLQLGDDDSTRIQLPFSFQFFNSIYSEFYLNSDGNITFGEADGESAARSLGRTVSGPPRIAALFVDLDPSQGGTVQVATGAGRVTITWSAVPEYRSFGSGPAQNAQIRLFDSGVIEIALGNSEPSEAVVGIAPGRTQGSTKLVNFTNLNQDVYEGAVLERFGGGGSLDIIRAAQRFYETHEDSYDYLVFFNDLGISAGSGALASETTVRSYTLGNGDENFDSGYRYGSPARLQAVMNMGPLSQYPSDPYARVGQRGLITGDNTMTLLGHEAGHLFLALASIRDPLNPSARPLLGSQNAHWNFNFNSEASLLEGNRIIDHGPGAVPRFRTAGTVEGYSPLDQYLMGLRGPEEVPPTFLVTRSSIGGSTFPQSGVGIDGERRDVTVEEIAAAEGRRTPDHTVAQRFFRFAFVLVVPEGTAPNQAQIEKVEVYRQEFERYFNRVTGGRAFADTGLRRAVNLTGFPATGRVAGQVADSFLSLKQTAQEPLTFVLRSGGLAASVPAEVTVPAGEWRVAIPIAGKAAGVDDLVIEPQDSRYETLLAKVAVAGDARDLILRAYTTGASVMMQILDRNNVPYPGLRVTAKVEGEGSVDAAVKAADEFGLVVFQRRGPGLFRAALELDESVGVTLPGLE